MATPEFRGTGLWLKNGFDDEGRPPHLQRIPVGATAIVLLGNAPNLEVVPAGILPGMKGKITIRENQKNKSALYRYIYHGFARG